MKKILSFTLVLLLICLCTAPVFSRETTIPANSIDVQTEILPDGSLFIVTMTQEAGQKGPVQSVTKTKTGSLVRNGVTVWEISLTASFDYNGTSTYCTEASSGYTIYNSAWILSSRSVSKSGNSAVANFTLKQYSSGVVVETISRTLTMSCSVSGTVV